jgi:hypothetical protein
MVPSSISGVLVGWISVAEVAEVAAVAAASS